MLHQNFEGYKPEVQELICVADRLGSLMQYETPGFLPNKRIHRGIHSGPGTGSSGHAVFLQKLLVIVRTQLSAWQSRNGQSFTVSWRTLLLQLGSGLWLPCRFGAWLSSRY